MEKPSIPPLWRVRQSLDRTEIKDAAEAVVQALDAAPFAGRLRPGIKVALTAGSRGIDRIPQVIKAVVQWLKSRGADPFIVPAMGSHGGATPRGRREVLKSLGITEDSVSARIEDGTETKVLGRVQGVPVHCSAAAADADAIIAVNRIKPHTSFTAACESGLAKMLAVGLGHQESATAAHARGAPGLADLVPKMAELVIKKAPVIMGLALVENGYDRLFRVVPLAPEMIMDQEPKLLQEAYRLRPVLPFEQAHVLVVDCMGKDISGTGMDTKVIGRIGIPGQPEPDRPRINRIAVLRLSSKSAGSAYGVGLADFTTEALLRAMDREVTTANALASTFVERARVPLAFASDREAVTAAINTCASPDPQALMLARIRDTLHLDEMLLTRPLLDTASATLEVVEGPIEWRFDPQGNLDI